MYLLYYIKYLLLLYIVYNTYLIYTYTILTTTTNTLILSYNTPTSGKILVTGPDSASVQRARELLELQEECIPLESRQIEWLSSKYNGHMLSKCCMGV